MKISDAEIASRKVLFQITDDQETALVECQALVEPHIEQIVEQFYSRMTAHSATRLLIGDLETFTRLQASMKGYVRDMFAGEYGRDYVNKRLRIGKVHERIGVDPKLYVSAVHLLDSTLTNLIREQLIQQNRADEVAKYCDAVRKLLMFDIHFVFDTYTNSLVSQVDTARQELERYAHDLEAMVAERTQQLRDLSRRDGLTGLFNQRAFQEQISREMAGVSRYGAKMCLAFIDLNEFKSLNDEQGHRAGDEVLQIVAEVLKDGLRETDFACRYGGDEFVVILPHTEAKLACQLLDRLTTAFDARSYHGITFSIGVVEVGPDQFASPEELLREADRTMYRAKQEAHESGEPRHRINIRSSALTESQEAPSESVLEGATA